MAQRFLPAAAVALALGIGVVAAAQPGPATVKVGFWNIRSGWGAQPLRGHPVTFANNANCTRPDQPMNAWGVGVVGKALSTLASDPTVVALGLAEAWICASPSNVRKALGWRETTEERNGTALVARYGFKGRPEWLQLDTSRNKSPKDTMWVVGARVCLDARCDAVLPVYATHWSGTGPEAHATSDKQAADTVAMMAHAGGPHVLVGDLNVFEGQPVCHQQPNNSTLQVLRKAGYVDAWPAVHGDAEGYTGMVNRAGCGQPEGYTWKRIDYAWSKDLTPVGIERFGVVPPGDGAPSDHYGILAAYRGRGIAGAPAYRGPGTARGGDQK